MGRKSRSAAHSSHPRARGFADDLAQQDAHAVVVVEAGSGLFRHGAAGGVGDPLVAGLEDHRGVGGVVVGLAGGGPFDPAAHGEEVLQRRGGAPRIRRVGLVGLQVGPRRGLDAGQVALVHGDAERHGRHALGDGLKGVEVGVAVERVPSGVVVVVLVGGGVLLGCEELGVALGVVPAAVGDDATVADEEEVVDQAVAPGVNVGQEGIDRAGVHAFGFGGGDGPLGSGPLGGGLLGWWAAGEGRWGEGEGERAGERGGDQAADHD